MIDSVLDDVAGIGAKRKRALIREFGSLKKIRAASVEDLATVLPQAVAGDLYAVLHT
jgi:excinuclease ABC subunit C